MGGVPNCFRGDCNLRVMLSRSLINRRLSLANAASCGSTGLDVIWGVVGGGVVTVAFVSHPNTDNGDEPPNGADGTGLVGETRLYKCATLHETMLGEARLQILSSSFINRRLSSANAVS